MVTVEEVRDRLSNVPSDFNFVTHVIDSHADKGPDSLAIFLVKEPSREEIRLTYGQLSQRSMRAAAFFHNVMGLRKGDRVLIQLPRVVEWWEVVFGLMRIGAVPIPGTMLLSSKDIAYRSNASNAKAFVGDEESLPKFLEAAAKSLSSTRALFVRNRNDIPNLSSSLKVYSYQGEIDRVPITAKCDGEKPSAKDICLIYFTSGTTGNPKMVAHSHTYPLSHLITATQWLLLRPDPSLSPSARSDTTPPPQSLFWNHADPGWAKFAYSVFSTLIAGAALFVQAVPAGTPFNPADVVDILHRYPITTLCCPPTVYRALVQPTSAKRLRERPPAALERCVGAGEPLNPSVVVAWQEITPNRLKIYDGYGQTETVIVCYNGDERSHGELRPGSMGRPLEQIVEMEVLDTSTMAKCKDGEEGEMAIRLDTKLGRKLIFEGYIGQDGTIDTREKTGQDGSQWYLTGDRGRKDEDGYFWFVGRADDVITSAGYRIGPFEVESALKEHPAVRDSAVVGSPDEARGEIVKAFVLVSDEYRARIEVHEDRKTLIKEIQDHVKAVTAPYKYPREIEFVESLPLTISGKTRRVELRAKEYRDKKQKSSL